MPFGIAEAVAEPTATPPSAASPTTAYLRWIIKFLLRALLTRSKPARRIAPALRKQSALSRPRGRQHHGGDVGIDAHQRRHDVVKRVFRDQRVVQHQIVDSR